jgi:hypothetical protein
MNKVAIITSRFDITNKQLESFRKLLEVFDKEKNVFLIGGDEADYNVFLTLLGQGFGVELYPRAGNNEDVDKFNGAKVINNPLPLRERNKRMIDESTIVVGIPQTFNEYEDSPAWKTIRFAIQNDKEIYVISPNGYSWGLE